MKDLKEQLIKKVNTLRWNLQRIKLDYESQIKKYENAIEAINEITSESEQLSLLPDEHSEEAGANKTLRTKVIEALTDYDSPITSRDIMELINSKYPSKTYTFPQFSAQFSMLYRRTNSEIKQYSVKNVPISKSAFYYLEAWEEDGKLRKDYKEKISIRYGIKY